MVRIPEGSAPDFKNKSYRITAEVEIPESGAEGVLMTQGGRFNGLGLYLLQGKPVFHYNLVGVDQTSIAAKDALDPGKHVIIIDFKYDEGGSGPRRGPSLTRKIRKNSINKKAQTKLLTRCTKPKAHETEHRAAIAYAIA